MKKLKNMRALTREELIKIQGGTPQNAGDCSNFIDLSPAMAMPEPGRYCLSDA
ncbi:hypothetical protein [uncultured Aquimarina sp.]|uniref:hypothetical protein n=1 Tax=uncultured Aquimarina sp. TaxID=575652 RepID=UPI0026348A33|nr:hypothetical protein [uncultured Aquimarina sp.]